MYRREFEALLSKALPRAVLLYGEDDYLCEHYVTMYKDKLQAREDALSLYFDEYDFERAKNYLSQTSLFGGVNLLIVKTDKKIPKKELDTLVALTQKNSANYFIYRYEGAPTQAKSLQSAFSDKTGGVWVRLFAPSLKESIALLTQKARELGVKIDHYALAHLLSVLNNDTAMAANELEKLAVLEGKVTAKDIDRLVYSAAPLAVESLWGELFDKKRYFLFGFYKYGKSFRLLTVFVFYRPDFNNFFFFKIEAGSFYIQSDKSKKVIHRRDFRRFLL